MLDRLLEIEIEYEPQTIHLYDNKKEKYEEETVFLVLPEDFNWLIEEIKHLRKKNRELTRTTRHLLYLEVATENLLLAEENKMLKDLIEGAKE